MAYNQKQILNSETAYKVLRKIHQGEKGSYPKRISEDLDTHSNTISDMIKVMRDMSLVKRGERSKAQFYILDYQGLYDYWTSDLLEKYKKNAPDFQHKQDAIEDFKEAIETDTPIEEVTESDHGEISTFLIRYLSEYLSSVENSTINEMLYDNIHEGMRTELQSRAKPGDVQYDITWTDQLAVLHQILNHALRENHPIHITQQVLKKELTEKKVETRVGKEDIGDNIDTESIKALQDTIETLYDEGMTEKELLQLTKEETNK
jgi:regulator of replication initiation timing